jgi:hypothetical protein
MDLQVVNHKNIHTQNMKIFNDQPLYSVFEEVYNHGRTKDKSPEISRTDICNDDIPYARPFALGLVAQRMNILNKMKNAQALPSDALVTFRSWAIENGHDGDMELIQKVNTGNERSFGQFNSDDDVVWKIIVTFGEDAQHSFLVYNSENGNDEVLQDLLIEAMFLADRLT